MRDKTLNILGFFIIIFIIIITFLPINYFLILYTNLAFGLFINLPIGILFVAGGIKSNKKVFFIGLILGFCIWIGLLLGAIGDISWNRAIKLMNDFFIFRSIISKKSVSLINLLFVIVINNIHPIGLLSAIVRLIILIDQFVLGLVFLVKYFQLDRQREPEPESEPEKLCPNCLMLIPNNAINCEHCGINIRDFKIERQRFKPKVDDYCPYCNKSIEKSANFCTNCGIKLKICKICNHFINFEEKTVSCPNCANEFHELEFLEWIKIKASCPVCRVEIDLWEFQKIAKENK